jgi:dTDP-4-dehydrorhamnose reductase
MKKLRNKKTKVLIFGGTGMLGHKLWQVFAKRFETYVTVRSNFAVYERYEIFDRSKTLTQVTVQDFDSVIQVISRVKPTVVVNCIGVVKQKMKSVSRLESILINSLFPHRLANLCLAANSRLIQISTDCVFSGDKGGYVESDTADARDIYGRTKLLGEIDGEGLLTLRSSIIGRELSTTHGLIEWFLNQNGKTVMGYKKAIFSGFPTIVLADILARIIVDYPNLEGVWHVASDPISKFDLLNLVRQTYELDIDIEPDEEVVVDRSLNADRFSQMTGFDSLPWGKMMERMYQDPTPYTKIRRKYAK